MCIYIKYKMSISWTYISKYSLENSPDENFGRELKIETEYKKFKQELKLKNISLKENIMTNYFNDGKKYILNLNKFPYNLVKEIQHNVLWINPNYNDEFNNNNSKIYTLLNELIDKPFIVFKNNSTNMSIPDVIHYQVFIKNK